MPFESNTVERKELAIMRILSESQEPAGARVIAHQLNRYGLELGERGVRYHLKLMDERGLTYLVGKRDGRTLTEKGRAEVRSALVKDKVGFAIVRIETLAFRTTFDWKTLTGAVPVNISFFDRDDFSAALKAMKPAFDTGLCTSELVAIAPEGEKLGEVLVPAGKMGIATVCSIVYNGALLKAGIPMDSKYGGILQLRDNKAYRFAELIDYTGCSLDPSTIFIRARMTSVGDVATSGDGGVLANFREIPSICRDTAEELIAGLNSAGFHGLVMMGETSEAVCEMPVGVNKIGIVLLGGLNPIAAAEEAGIHAENMASSTVMDYRDFVTFREAAIDFRDLKRFWENST